jgi:PhnB protein
MARKVSPVPKGYHTVTPVLVVQNAAAAIEFYKTTFNAQELSRTYAADGVIILRAEIKIGNSIFHVNDEMPAFGIMSPTTLGGVASANHLYHAEVDDIWERAIEAGASIVMPLENMYWGDRYGKFVDPYGHVWALAKRLESLTEKEISARLANLLAPVKAEPMTVIDIAEALAEQNKEENFASENESQEPAIL